MKTKILLTVIISIYTSLLFAQPILPFTAYTGNPVLEHGEPGTWDQGNILWSFMFAEGNTYYLYYSSSTDIWSQPISIGVAISTDGYNFTKSLENPIFEPDQTGFDAWAVSFPVVIKSNGEYILFYGGGTNAGNSSIGQATASDPEEPFIPLYDDPIIERGSSGEWDSQSISPESVIQTDTALLLYYTGSKVNNPWRVGMAYLPNGATDWIKYDDPLTTDPPFEYSDPVLKIGDPGDWDDETAALCHVNKTVTGLEMFYTGSNSDNFKIGYASSVDGITWSKDLENPIYSYEDDPFAVDSGYHVAANPTVVVKDTMYYMYYDYGLMGEGYISLAIADVITGISDQIDLFSVSSINIFPNPVKKETLINYIVKSKSPVKLSIHNLNGQLVSILVNEVQQQGEQRIEFNTTGLPAGIYFCVLKTNNGMQTEKMIKLN
ncbi:MAG: T9SS type A sorting domain-containing protein [Bacteroidales bacterium]|nr:T9SS type A sorting domain-containing protein [Bacteroidales bacterium]